MNDAVNVIVDGREITVKTGATALEAAASAGVEIPTLCHFGRLPHRPSCMVCAVRINQGPHLCPACSTILQEGDIVDASSKEIVADRKLAVECLLGAHQGDCTAPCDLVCPLGTKVQERNALVREGRIGEALDLLLRDNPLPSVCAALCKRPCEKICRLNGEGEAVSIAAIEGFLSGHDDVSFLPGDVFPRSTANRRIAVVGAGPVGLTAAWHLRLSKYDVEVFDAKARPGGSLLRVSKKQLPIEWLEGDLKRFVHLGIQFRLGRVVDPEDLRRRFDAVVLCAGSLAPSGKGWLRPGFLSNRRGRAQTQRFLQRMGISPDRESGVLAKGLLEKLSSQGVYVAGPLVFQNGSVVRQMADVRRTLNEIRSTFEQQPVEKSRTRRTVSRRRSPRSAEFPLNTTAPSTSKKSERLNLVSAMSESARCLECACVQKGMCELAKIAGKLKARQPKWSVLTPPRKKDLFDDGLISIDSSLCIFCGRCVGICREIAKESLLGFIGRGVHTRVVASAPARDTGCTQSCRLCIENCPVGALSLKSTRT